MSVDFVLSHTHTQKTKQKWTMKVIRRIFASLHSNHSGQINFKIIYIKKRPNENEVEKKVHHRMKFRRKEHSIFDLATMLFTVKIRMFFIPCFYTQRIQDPNFLGHLMSTAHFPSFLVPPFVYRISYQKRFAFIVSWELEAKISRRITCCRHCMCVAYRNICVWMSSWNCIHTYLYLSVCELAWKKGQMVSYVNLPSFQAIPKVHCRCLLLTKRKEKKWTAYTRRATELTYYTPYTIGRKIKTKWKNENVIKMNYLTLSVDLSCRNKIHI